MAAWCRQTTCTRSWSALIRGFVTEKQAPAPVLAISKASPARELFAPTTVPSMESATRKNSWPTRPSAPTRPPGTQTSTSAAFAITDSEGTTAPWPSALRAATPCWDQATRRAESALVVGFATTAAGNACASKDMLGRDAIDWWLSTYNNQRSCCCYTNCSECKILLIMYQ